MREVKDSGIEWIGQIPKDWEIAPLRRFAVSKTGMTPSKDDTSLWEGTIPWASPKDLKSDHLSDTEDHISEEALENNSLELIEAGNVIICVRSGILRHTFPVAINDVPMTINQDLRALTLASNINPSFVLYYFLGMNELILALTRKIGTTVESIEMEWLMNFPLILIPRNEQEITRNEQDVIVDYLDAKCAEIDKVIKAKEDLNEKLREYRQSVIYEAVTKGLDKNAKMKDSGIEWIGKIPEDWRTIRVKYICDIDKEKLSEKTDVDYTFNYIDISSVTDVGGIGETIEMEFAKSPSRARMVVKLGDIIISTVRTYLKAIAYIEDSNKYICSTGFCVITPHEVYNKYMYYFCFCEYFIQKIVSKSVGVSYPAINSTDISNIKIVMPKNIIKQKQIADYLDKKCEEIDSLIATNDTTIKKLKEYRQSVIYEAVTGKTVVIYSQ